MTTVTPTHEWEEGWSKTRMPCLYDRKFTS